jgi:predicted signal transduction protein with EAL and GGDEF domain
LFNAAAAACCGYACEASQSRRSLEHRRFRHRIFFVEYLNRFPVDTLKIDRSFVTSMNAADENLQIVKTIITLAGNLGMQVVAEGVETEEQLDQLRSLMCHFGQGFLFSKPLEVTDADLFVLNSARAGSITELAAVDFAM